MIRYTSHLIVDLLIILQWQNISWYFGHNASYCLVHVYLSSSVHYWFDVILILMLLYDIQYSVLYGIHYLIFNIQYYIAFSIYMTFNFIRNPSCCLSLNFLNFSRN